MTQTTKVTNGAALTPRDKEMLTLVFRGMTPGEVADQLGLARRTVDSRLCGICDKLGVRTRLQAFGEATRRGWLPPS
jgi:DNA-binding CsgD family transcriptional regulator